MSFRAWLTKITTRPAEPNKLEIAETIADFINDRGGAYDWDDFCSCHLRDPELEKLRYKIAGFYKDFPSTQKGEWCNSEGIEKLKEIERQLRSEIL